MLEVTHEALFSVIYSSRDFFLYTVSFAQVEEFYVQLDSRYKAELKVPPRAEMLRATNVAVKQLVCVRNKAEDCFFRSQILKANDDGSFFVRNIDFGDRLKVQPDDIFTLHEEFCSQPAMAVHCYIDGKWDQCNAMFDTLILSFDKFPEPTDFFDAARVTIYPSLVDGSKYPVSVEVKTRAGQNWKELLEVPLDKTCVTVPQTIKSKLFCFKDFLTSAGLTEENFDERSPEGYQQLTQFFGHAVHLLKLGEPTSSVSKLRCIYVACVSRFALVAESAADLVTNMSLFYWGNLERPFAGNVNPGSLVVFALKRFFFRGLVMKSSSAHIEVYAIDLGFTVSVPVSALRPLFSPLFSLERLPPKALIAGLERITSPYGSGKWQSIAVETLKSIARGREVVVVPSRFQGGTYAVDLTACSEGQGQEQNAIALLKKFKLAKDIA
ncbi:Tudor domain [Tyrophagus putrescentiae]|nr:Tudor domain [Tyrophagus putrescentiae]